MSKSWTATPKKAARFAVSAATLTLGGLVATSKFHRSIRALAQGDINGAVDHVQYDTLGAVPTTGVGDINMGAVKSTVITMAVGGGIIFAGKLINKYLLR